MTNDLTNVEFEAYELAGDDRDEVNREELNYVGRRVYLTGPFPIEDEADEDEGDEFDEGYEFDYGDLYDDPEFAEPVVYAEY